MKPVSANKVVESLDKMSKKLLMLVVSLLVGYVISALIVNYFSNIFSSEYLKDLPRWLVLGIPLFFFLFLQVSVDSILFELQSFLEKSRQEYLALMDSDMDKIKLEIDTFERKASKKKEGYLSEEIARVRGEWLKRKRKLDRIISKSKGRVKAIADRRDEWHDEKVHIYLACLVGKFLWLSLMVISTAATGNWLLFVVFMYFYLSIINEELFRTVGAVLRLMALAFGSIAERTSIIVRIRFKNWFGARSRA